MPTVSYSQNYSFSSNHVQMWELDHKAGWPQNCGVGENSWEYLEHKEIKPVNPKGNQSWIFIGRTDAEAEALILWPPDGKNWRIGKRPWGWEILKAGGEGSNRGWDGRMASLMDMSLSKLKETGKDKETWHAAIHGVAKSRTCLSNWTTTIYALVDSNSM